jgi:hypothetical protein
MSEMLLSISNTTIFTPQVKALFQALDHAGFFEESMLIGSWVMPLYQEAFGMPYTLRTLDIDFAVKLAASDRGKKVDLEKIITSLGYVPVMMQSGICKYTLENFSIEFVVHRKGGSDEDVVAVRKWNVTAVPLPFINILLDFSFIADLGAFRLKAPIPEAYFIQKMLIAQRRPGESKRDKDLEQCSVIAHGVDSERLSAVVESLRLSAKSKKALLVSCEAIGFPPQRLRLQ